VSYGAYRGAGALTERGLRDEFVRIGQLMHSRGYVTATDGNISARLGESRFLVTPSGLSKGFMTPDQMVVVDWELRPVGESRYGAARNLKPSSEMLLHLETYRQRPDVRAVVHAHPATAITLSIAGIAIAPCLLPEVIVTLGTIPTTEYATPASAEGATVIRQHIARHDAVILQRHGSVTVGATPFDAYLKLEKLEHAAEVTYRLLLVGREEALAPAAVDKLIAKREAAGLLRPGEGDEIRQACRVCRASAACAVTR
jgi:L-fuculose-phosphate aldolase